MQLTEKQNILPVDDHQENLLALESILKNAEEGLFLLDRDFLIKPQYSRALTRILGKGQLAYNDFIFILQNALTPAVYQNSKDYLELMFRPDINEMDFNELNPLSKAEYISPETGEVKYLSFNFKRIYDEDQIRELIVTVVDQSESVLLENKLKVSEEQSKRQVDLLHILQSEPVLLKEFLPQTAQGLKNIRSQLSAIGSDLDLQNIYREMHSIKGSASLLEFSYLALKSHQFEEIIKSNTHPLYGVRIDQPALKGLLDEMISTIKEINEQVGRISTFSEQFNSFSSSSGDLIVKAVSNLVNRLNREFDQQVDFVHKNFDPNLIAARDFLVLKDVLIQLTHNSLSHGIEPLAERRRLRKNTYPTITLSSRVLKDKYQLSFRDDGRGIQVEALREKARATGKWSETVIAAWSDKQVENIVFVPGITTCKSADLLSGRGMGMDIVKQKIEKLGGNVEINSQRGKFCEFIIQLPFARIPASNREESLNQARNCV